MKLKHIKKLAGASIFLLALVPALNENQTIQILLLVIGIIGTATFFKTIGQRIPNGLPVNIIDLDPGTELVIKKIGLYEQSYDLLNAKVNGKAMLIITGQRYDDGKYVVDKGSKNKSIFTFSMTPVT